MIRDGITGGTVQITQGGPGGWSLKPGDGFTCVHYTTSSAFYAGLKFSIIKRFLKVFL